MLKKLFVILFISIGYSSIAQLSGLYTIDPGLPVSATNYHNFESVTGDLKEGSRTDGGIINGPGVSSAVDVSVATGTYEESLHLEKYAGVSDINRITFHSATEDSTDVIILFETVVLGPGTLPLYLKEAQYFNIRHLTFQNTGASYAQVVDIRESSSYNNFIGNQFIGVDALYESDITDFSVINFQNTGCFGGCPSPGFCEDNVFENNLILNGSRSVLVQRQGFSEATAPKGTVFRNNVMEGYTSQGMSITETEDILIQGNDIFQRDSAKNANGIYLLGFDESDVRIIDNDIRINVNQFVGGDQTAYGIVVSGDTDLASEEDSLIIENNFISVQGVGSTYGIIVFDMQYMEVVVNHNSILTIPGVDVSTNCGLCFGAQTIMRENLTLFNNNVVAENFGIPVVISEESMIANMDYNNIYSTVDTLVGTGLTTEDFYYGLAPGNGYLTVASWNVESGYDANSISINPDFVSAEDLHTFSCALIESGTAIESVLYDIDNELRADPPTIGADEITEGYILIDVTESICEGEIIEFGGELYTDAGIYVYEALGVDGCDSSYTLNLTVNPLPEIDLGDDLFECDSDIEVSIDAGDGDFDYDWSNGETTQVIELSIADLGTGEHDYSVEITDDNGCSNSDAILLTIHELPEVNLGLDSEVCHDGSIITLNAGPLGEEYEWNTGETDQIISVDPAENDPGEYIYHVEVINEFGCITIDSITITIHALPVVDLGDDFEVCDTISELDLDAGLWSEYDWNTGGTDQIITINPSDLGAGTFTYSVSILDDNDCSNADTIIITIVDCIGVGITENINALNLNVYPNPANNEITIKRINSIDELALILYNTSGKVVWNGQLRAGESDLFVSIDYLAKGIYYLRANDQVLKIIKQ